MASISESVIWVSLLALLILDLFMVFTLVFWKYNENVNIFMLHKYDKFVVCQVSFDECLKNENVCMHNNLIYKVFESLVLPFHF